MNYLVPTFTGRFVDLVDPQPETIDPLDIAVALAREPRWRGHTVTNWTVAQHSLIVAALVGEPFAYTALMHDAAEAYLGDFTRPMKVLLGDRFRAIEQRMEEAIALRFHIDYPFPAEVVDIDNRMQATEREQLMVSSDVLEPAPPLPIWLNPCRRRRVLHMFVDRFVELSGESIDRSKLPGRRSVLPAWPKLYQPKLEAA
jgi:hypothetical protein